jgi:hypothetical protein
MPPDEGEGGREQASASPAGRHPKGGEGGSARPRETCIPLAGAPDGGMPGCRGWGGPQYRRR